MTDEQKQSLENGLNLLSTLTNEQLPFGFLKLFNLALLAGNESLSIWKLIWSMTNILSTRGLKVKDIATDWNKELALQGRQLITQYFQLLRMKDDKRAYAVFEEFVDLAQPFKEGAMPFMLLYLWSNFTSNERAYIASIHSVQPPFLKCLSEKQTDQRW